MVNEESLSDFKRFGGGLFVRQCDHPNKHTSCIKTVPIFSSVSFEEMLEIAAITEARNYQKGEMVYTAGDQGGKLYVLHTGKVRITRINPNGKEQVIRILGPGDFMGELSLFSSMPLTDNAQVLEDSTMCVIEGAKLKELMAKNPIISFKIIDELSQRLDKLETRIEAISLSSVEERLAQALLELFDTEIEIVLPMTKGDLASQLGMSQETLSRKLGVFQEQNLIKLEGHRKIILLDKDGLEKVAQGYN